MSDATDTAGLSLIEAAQRRIAHRERLIALLDDAAHAIEGLQLDDLSAVDRMDATRLQNLGWLSLPGRLRAIAARLARANGEEQDRMRDLRGES